MKDALGREIDYLRVSITDRCNLRCRYCQPDGVEPVGHGDILTYEEIGRLVGVFASLGVKKVRVTGGEPLARRGWFGLLERLRRVPGIERLTMTTNAVALPPWVDHLAALKLDGLNVSLDSVDRAVYARMTGRDALSEVLAALDAALDEGIPVKLNCVPVRGVNEHGLADVAALAEARPVDVRFIELMPMGAGAALTGMPGDELLKLMAARYPGLAPDPARRGSGPARYYEAPGLTGRIGFIDALSHRFCADCSRVRLTSQGYLKLCLGCDDGLDLRALLRGGADDGELRAGIERAVWAKPARHAFERAACPEGMSRIGG
ncbi:MAG: GTP 3',8-cyclase MoaA [Christensenellaceae bacterium]|nr:GTP 3',8-cyclase MoaA [Christensenellaceae bacterium]MEA5068857.1 GTP 3',8-cyclase MoaA [Christensenellaceae bacterium]